MKPISDLGYKVAPSFTNFNQESDVYIKNKKPYVDMRNPSTGTLRSVRVYTDHEWQRQYGKKDMLIEKPTTDLEVLKKARGFRWGPIMLISTADERWLSDTKECRYATDIGWYIASDEDLPVDYPKDLKRELLSWDKFKEEHLNVSKE